MMQHKIQKWLFIGMLLFCQATLSFATTCMMWDRLQYLHTLKQLQDMPYTTTAQRIVWISQQFLNTPYVMNPLGEGAIGRYDQCPLYRLDRFDCETFVTSVVALALSHHQKEYEYCLRQLRYINGQVGFITRKHFTHLDWNLRHQAQGLTRDITTTIKNQQGMSIAQVSHTPIDKGHWLSKMTSDRIRLKNKQLKSARLKELHTLQKQFPVVISHLPYLPLTTLLSPESKALFKQIPHGAIIEMVRPQDLTNTIGTHLDISHLGFAIWKKGTLYLRHASSIHRRIIDEPLYEYLKKYQHNPTMKGIHVQVVTADHC